MSHDPLCSVQDDDPPPLQLLCICGELSAARRDMLGRCIAAVEAMLPHFGKHEGWQMQNSVIAALRALQTP